MQKNSSVLGPPRSPSIALGWARAAVHAPFIRETGSVPRERAEMQIFLKGIRGLQPGCKENSEGGRLEMGKGALSREPSVALTPYYDRQ